MSTGLCKARKVRRASKHMARRRDTGRRPWQILRERHPISCAPRGDSTATHPRHRPRRPTWPHPPPSSQISPGRPSPTPSPLHLSIAGAMSPRTSRSTGPSTPPAAGAARTRMQSSGSSSNSTRPPSYVSVVFIISSFIHEKRSVSPCMSPCDRRRGGRLPSAISYLSLHFIILCAGSELVSASLALSMRRFHYNFPCSEILPHDLLTRRASRGHGGISI